MDTPTHLAGIPNIMAPTLLEVYDMYNYLINLNRYLLISMYITVKYNVGKLSFPKVQVQTEKMSSLQTLFLYSACLGRLIIKL